jgi:uncharacterized membrane protein YeiH
MRFPAKQRMSVPVFPHYLWYNQKINRKYPDFEGGFCWMSTTWTILEMTGIVAFAFSGSLVGISRRMDIFGMIVLAVATAVGGGMMRDVLAGLFPPLILRDPFGLFLAVTTACLVFAGYEMIQINRREKKLILIAYHISDTIGLASFTVTGAVTAIRYFPDNSAVLPVMLGLITAVGGGMMRDVLAQRIPVVLKADVYAVVSAGGALITYITWYEAGLAPAYWSGFFFVLAVRLAAIYFRWDLPHPKRMQDHSRS